MKTAYYFFVLLIAVTTSLCLRAQPDKYILNGTASRNNCNCYTLTNATMWQAGSVWNKEKIDLTESFDFTFNVYLGCTDMDGADGIAFIMQPISTSIGTSGEGMGFEGVQPSIGIALDTWQNSNRNDPVYDHISIQKNGIVDHGHDLAGPVPISATSENVEDCQWHLLRIAWNPATKSLRSYFDGKLRVETTIDLVGDVFQNDPKVYWGFSAATGGNSNLHQFCTALNPKMTATPDTSCITPNGNRVAFTDISESFAPVTNYFWDLGDGSTCTLANPPIHTYEKPGVYNIKMAITGKDGCNSDTLTKKVVVGSYPKAAFQIHDTCERANPRIVDLSTNDIGSISNRKWFIDDQQEQTSSIPNLEGLLPGTHNLALKVATEYGCASAITSNAFTVKERPRIISKVSDGCLNESIAFEGAQEGQISINNWYWSFGDGLMAQVQNPPHAFTKKGSYQVAAWAMGSSGCSSDTVRNTVQIEEAAAFAGKDTMVLQNTPFMLNGAGNGTFSWWPSNSLNDALIAKPVATLSDDQTYVLTVTTPMGCTNSDEVKITVFKGSAIYVPNAFTPNGDSFNDILRPSFKGVNSLQYFYLYNRWGEMIFKTTDLSKGWDGTSHGKPAIAGTYVWILKATDYVGKVYQMKGTATLIR